MFVFVFFDNIQKLKWFFFRDVININFYSKFILSMNFIKVMFSEFAFGSTSHALIQIMS